MNTRKVFPHMLAPEAGTILSALHVLLLCMILNPDPQPCLLLQDMASWSRDGIAGLQSVVLYSLPELDGGWR